MTPLRRLLARNLLGIQIPLVAILLGLAWWGTRSMLLDLAQRDGMARLNLAVEALDRRLTVVQRAGNVISSYWNQGRLPLSESERAVALLIPWLVNQEEQILVNLLDEQGQSLLLLRGKEDWQARVIRLGPAGNLELAWGSTHQGQLKLAAQFRSCETYDPRKRPWYVEARGLKLPRWSTPYRLDPPASKLVMTWLVPLHQADGSFAGALGLDLLAEDTDHPAHDLASLLNNLRPTSGSRLWLLDRGGMVLASARGNQIDAAVPVFGDRVVIGGLPHRILRKDLPGHPGSQWRMVLAIPEQDLLAPARGWLWGLTALSTLLLLLPTFWGLWVGRRLASEVQSLAEAAQALGAGQAPSLYPTRVTEFQTLGQALLQAHAEVHERILLQQRLQHSQRLETLGTMAGGIAHDVNNQLSAILGQLFLAREAIPAGQAAGMRLAQAEEAVNRCARTTRALLSFSHQGTPDSQALDINELVRTSAELLDRVLGGLVHVELDLTPDLPPIQGERLQLEQVLMNMAVNARDAMPDGGRIAFRTHLDTTGQVVLAVKDTGAGMPPEVLPHIFEPFFTTKPIGRGTGLGLSMAFGIVQAHGGRLDVESTLGQGTTFTLTFPADLSPRPHPAPSTFNQETKGPLAGLRVLVAEDETYLREILVDALTVAQARVAGAADGDEAWQLFQAGPFDLILSDQRMPLCTGIELLQRIRTSGSCIPFILASGQDLEPFRSNLAADPWVCLLAKPFSMAKLVEQIEAMRQAPCPSV